MPAPKRKTKTARVPRAQAAKPQMRPYKFVVVAVVQEIKRRDIVCEHETQPVTLYGVDALTKWADEFPSQLAALDPNRKDT